MNVGVDIDGTVDSFPRVFQSVISALHAAGHHVYVISGVSAKKVAPQDVDNKRQYLTSQGIGPHTYTGLIVVPQPHPKNKVAQIKKLGIDLMVENKKATAKKAAKHAASLLLVNSKEK